MKPTEQNIVVADKYIVQVRYNTEQIHEDILAKLLIELNNGSTSGAIEGETIDDVYTGIGYKAVQTIKTREELLKEFDLSMFVLTEKSMMSKYYYVKSDCLPTVHGQQIEHIYLKSDGTYSFTFRFRTIDGRYRLYNLLEKEVQHLLNTKLLKQIMHNQLIDGQQCNITHIHFRHGKRVLSGVDDAISVDYNYGSCARCDSKWLVPTNMTTLTNDWLAYFNKLVRLINTKELLTVLPYKLSHEPTSSKYRSSELTFTHKETGITLNSKLQ